MSCFVTKAVCFVFILVFLAPSELYKLHAAIKTIFQLVQLSQYNQEPINDGLLSKK